MAPEEMIHGNRYVIEENTGYTYDFIFDKLYVPEWATSNVIYAKQGTVIGATKSNQIGTPRSFTTICTVGSVVSLQPYNELNKQLVYEIY